MLHNYTAKNRCARALVPPSAGTAALGREPFSSETCRRAHVESPRAELLGPNGTRLGQDFTYGQVRLDLSEPVRSPPKAERTLARFSST
jgi:hypothetical protein